MRDAVPGGQVSLFGILRIPDSQKGNLVLKHRSVLRAAVVLLAVSGLGASAVVFAESEERSASDSVIEEIVVTATHRETNLTPFI